jgi:hypothetical protein
MLDSTTGEVVRMTVTHEGNHVREFYSTLALPVRVGIEATRSMQWFVSHFEPGVVNSSDPFLPSLSAGGTHLSY